MGKTKEITVAGVTYGSLAEACKAKGVPYGRTKYRLRTMSVDDAFSGDLLNAKTVTVNGKTYESIAAASRAVGADESLVRMRLAKGWDVTSAVTAPNQRPMAKPRAVDGRVARGRAVVVDGVEYLSLNEASKASGIPLSTLHRRIRRGIEPKTDCRQKPVSVDGRLFESVTAACEHYGVDPVTYMNRVRNCGWTVEQALGVAPVNAKKCVGMIYLITQISTGKQYVGQTKRSSVESRFAEHVETSGRPNRKHGGLHLAIAECGKEDFVVVELSRHNTVGALNKAEVDAVMEYGTLAPFGFNRNKGGSHSRGAGKKVKFDGREYESVKELCKSVGAKYGLVKSRLTDGWDLSKAVRTPRLTPGLLNRRRVTVAGTTYPSISHACRAYGIPRNNINWRIGNGWTVEDAILTPFNTKR